ncbi:MAG: hypothetical protein M0T75_04630 [Chloroflexi bacterium]|nr:hypothetical protein [Chloroflexota bacterium]
MAKRQRGGSRPGQRAPLQRGGTPAVRPPAKPAAAPRPAGSLSSDDLARAEELEARIVAEERAAASSMARGRDRRRVEGFPAGRGRSAGTLAVVAEEEYRYVARDLRRIAAVFALIFGILIVSWLVIVVGGLVTI